MFNRDTLHGEAILTMMELPENGLLVFFFSFFRERKERKENPSVFSSEQSGEKVQTQEEGERQLRRSLGPAVWRGTMRTEMVSTHMGWGNDHPRARNGGQRAAPTNKAPRTPNSTPPKLQKMNLKIGRIHQRIHFILRQNKTIE